MKLTRSMVAAETVAVLMRSGLVPATELAEAVIVDQLNLKPTVLADARRRILGQAATAEDLPVIGVRRCPDPSPQEWEWLGFRAPEFALWRCRLCGRPFHVRRHHEAHMAAAGISTVEGVAA